MKNAAPENHPAPFSHVAFRRGHGGLPMIEVNTALGAAEVYLQGATVTHFQKRGDEPLLFVSQASRFQAGVPIRGGIPVVFPWFGPREGKPQHGYARSQAWDVTEVSTTPDGSVRVEFCLPDLSEAAALPSHKVRYAIKVGESLTCELTVSNESSDRPLEFETLLHTYFLLGDIREISVSGFRGHPYLDAVDQWTLKQEESNAIRIDQEVDRVFEDAPGPIELIDPVIGRKVRVEKTGSTSTVLWNPWIDKSLRMADFGDDEYQRMICIEPGNVRKNAVNLSPGKKTTLGITLSSEPL